MTLRADLKTRLEEHARRATLGQTETIRAFQDLLGGAGDPFSRENWDGHVTASALVTNLERDSILLVKHRKLGIWLQPGGHIEQESDGTVLAAALREVWEETGLRTTPLLDGAIMDLDIHEIPAHKTSPAHLHYDVRFVVEADDVATMNISAESTDMRWFALDDLARFPLHPSQQRLAMELKRVTSKERIRIPLLSWLTG